MAPKDFVNIDWNYFYSHLIKMNNEHEEDDDERNLTFVQHISSIDSLEQPCYENLHFISGYHQWINNNNENHRVDKLIDNDHHHQIELVFNNTNPTDDDDDDHHHSIELKTLSTNDTEQIFLKNKFSAEEEDEHSLSHMDISFDIQLQVNHEQYQQAISSKIFSSNLEKINLLPKNSNSYTSEMDMENEENHTRKTNGYSRNNNNNNEKSERTNNQQTNGENPNRNNNNSRRSNDDGSEENDDNDDDGDDDDDNDEDDDDDETDENIARRLGFAPLNTATIIVIGRLRNLTTKRSYDQQDLETFQNLIDELIRIQHLENFSKQQLKEIIHYLKLYRPLRNKTRTLIFLQERIPRRAVKYNVISSNNHETNSNVFNIWRERERRARLDSKDSLEDDGQNLGGQQLRDVIEINHPTPPIILSMTSSNPNITTTTAATTKVKQMAKDIDTRSIPSRSEINLRTGEKFNDHTYMPRSTSPIYPGLVSVAVYDIKSTNNNSNDGLFNENFNNKRLINPSNLISPTISEASRVRKMIDRLESSSTSSLDIKKDKKTSIRKSIHDDHSDGSNSLTSSPPVKRIARREHNEKNFINEKHDLSDEISLRNNISTEIKVDINQDDIRNGIRRTASGTTIEEYVTTLLPETETSISMVRDIRTRVYDDNTTVSRTDVENIPVKVDVETLYILEQKSDKKSLSPIINIYIPDYEYKHSTEQQDFSMQTTAPTATVKPPHRPIGTQVNSIIEQHTVAAQTTDSLHRPTKERQRLPTPPPPLSSSLSQENEIKKINTTTTNSTTTRYEIKRRHSSHRTSEDDDNDDDGAAVIYIDDKSKKSDYEDNFELKREKHHTSTDDQLPIVSSQRLPFGQVASRIRIDQLRDINRHVVRRHLQVNDYNEDEHRSSEVYEVHTRGACKCLVVSYEEKTQYGTQTRFEKQLQRIEQTYTDEELKATELHIIVTSSDSNYELVKRDYGLNKYNNDDEKENENIRKPKIKINYYNKEGHRMKIEHIRCLEHLPLVIRSEIEYELNHYGSAQLIILSVTNSERRQMNTSLKKQLVDEIVSRSCGHLSAKSPELEQEITRQLAEPTTLLHLVDYSSRDDYNQTNSTDLRRVSRIDVTTSLRLVQRYRTIIHRLCQLHRSHLRLTNQAEQQRHLLLVARDEYYLLDLTSQNSSISPNISNIHQRQHDIFKREVNNVIQQPFDFIKYRRDAEQQQRILEQRYQQRQMEQKQQIHKGPPPPPGHPLEAEFYLGTERRALIEREIHSMRESIRPHEHAPPRYKHEPPRRSLSISYTGAQRYVRARIIHVKDFYDENYQREQKQQQRQVKEQELFVRIDDYINESAANSLRRSYSTDYLKEDGPRSRIRYIRIPGETIKVEDKTTYAYKGVMYADLPYSLRYWNILSILDREARHGRPLGSTLPQIIVNDPYRTVIPPLTQHEIRQTAQQILSPQYNVKSYTDQTLRWFLSRDNRTEIESAKYLQTLHQYHTQQKQQNQLNIQSDERQQQGAPNKYYFTEKLVHYEKLPDRLIPLTTNNRVQSKEILHSRSPSIPRILHPPNLPSNPILRSQSQPRPYYQSSHGNVLQTRAQFSPMQSPLARHQSVHELYVPPTISHPPSPSPSLHNLHYNRRPVVFNNRFSSQQNPLLTEIIDSQTGQRILTTSQEQLPSEVLGLLNKYNLRQF